MDKTERTPLWQAVFAAAFAQQVEALYQTSGQMRQYKSRGEIAEELAYSCAESAVTVADAAVKGLAEVDDEQG